MPQFKILAPGSDEPLKLATNSTNNYIRFNDNSDNRYAAVGYYSNCAFLSNEKANYARLAITDSGIPQYWNNNLSSTAKELLHAGNYSNYCAPVSHSHNYLSTSGGTVNGTIVATGQPAFYASTGAGIWSYLRLVSGSVLWDVAVNSGLTSGALDFRPGGNHVGCYISTSGHLNATSGLTWNNANWLPSGNITCTPTANNQEWSIDVGSSSYTGSYWHVWSSRLNATMLACYADNRYVEIPVHLSVGYNHTGYTLSTSSFIASGSVSLGTTSPVSGFNVTIGGPTYLRGRIAIKGDGSSYNEGIRILPASNGWSNIFFSANDTLSDTHDGGWLIGRRGAAGSIGGAGDFTIEEQSSSGANLTIYKNSGGARLVGALTANGAMLANRGTSASTSGYQQSALEIREYGFGGAQADTWGYAPRLSFHWSERVAAQIGLASNGNLYMNNNASGSTTFVQIQGTAGYGSSLPGAYPIGTVFYKI